MGLIKFSFIRWGDAPVHSIAAALFLEKSDVHFFNDIAYRHEPFEHCPPEPRYHVSGNCQCNVSENFGEYCFDGIICYILHDLINFFVLPFRYALVFLYQTVV